MYVDDKGIEPLGETKPYQIGYQVPIRCSPDMLLLSKVVAPVISPAGTLPSVTVTLTCATSGAAIYYTLDGSHPWSGNTSAALYSTPFTLTEAKTVRAIAYKSGSLASDAKAAVIE